MDGLGVPEFWFFIQVGFEVQSHQYHDPVGSHCGYFVCLDIQNFTGDVS
jgi:hypothetical protein